MLSLVLALAAAPPLAVGFGSAPSKVGLVREPESSPEAPGSLAVDAEGRVYVLDAPHARVAVFLGTGSSAKGATGAGMGALAASIPLPSDTVEDIALLPSGDLAVLDRLVARTVYVIAASGTVVAHAAVEGAGVEDGGEVTALFADDTGVWLEVLRGAQVRVLDARLQPDVARATRPGLPVVAPGARADAVREFVRLRKVGDAAQVLFFDAKGALVGDGRVDFLRGALVELSGLVVSADGARVYVAGHELVETRRGRADHADVAPVRDAVVVVELALGAHHRLVERGRRAVRASPEFVPLKQLVASGDGVAHLFVDSRAASAGIEVASW